MFLFRAVLFCEIGGSTREILLGTWAPRTTRLSKVDVGLQRASFRKTLLCS